MLLRETLLNSYPIQIQKKIVTYFLKPWVPTFHSMGANFLKEEYQIYNILHSHDIFFANSTSVINICHWGTNTKNTSLTIEPLTIAQYSQNHLIRTKNTWRFSF